VDPSTLANIATALTVLAAVVSGSQKTFEWSNGLPPLKERHHSIAR
jgi:hypothetical protein